MKRGRLTPAVRTAALIFAEEHLAQLFADAEVSAKLQKRFHCTPAVGNAVVREALERLREADVDDKATRTARMHASIGRLYRKAEKAGRLQVCRGLLSDLRRMQGLDAPLKVAHQAASQQGDETNRTDAELEFYLEHGFYPDEAPRQGKPKLQPAQDPLAKLH
jgi:hypothetical protein